ncbi:oligoendopeptidase F [Anaeromicropila herbilytica]|uniref:Oligopeptidase F n=1 Tax=Anaeromicropila herbilytica TaxID=2785025 RepID=A0A7R7IDW6_9FIRM|nr:oligoendopeptidase F [Anaeromicropila herbilytica]BCN31386.1 oligoendopeptidase F [Anaeromicropila herbilytica]
MEITMKMSKHSDIKERYTWATSDLYENIEAWWEDYYNLQVMINHISIYKGRLSESSDILLDFFQSMDEVGKLIDRVYGYADRKVDEDTNNPSYQEIRDKALGLYFNLTRASAFSTPEIINIDNERMNTLLMSNNGIKKYKNAIIDIIRKKEHVLSAEMETLLASANEVAKSPFNTYLMLMNNDIIYPHIMDEHGNSIRVTSERIVSFLESKDMRVRREAFDAFYHTLNQFRSTLASTYNANVRKNIFFAKARSYETALEAALDDTNIPTKVYKNLIDSVHNNMHYMHRYVRLRKKLLNVEKLHMYDLYTPVVQNVDMHIPFEEAKNIVLEALKPLGDEYQEVLKQAFENRWIDVYENDGKRSGTSSSDIYGVHPYILLNYKDDLESLFKLAHEIGHAVHSYLSSKEQPYIYSKYETFVLEVGSMCNEAMLLRYLMLKSNNKLEKAYLINYFLEQFRIILYRQTMFAEYEMITYRLVEEGQNLSSELLKEVYCELNRGYFGEDIIIDEEIGMEWARIPHFYYNFYVYQFATGYGAAIAIFKRLLYEGEKAINDYIHFLKAGCSLTPIELLKQAGVDMTTSKPIDDALYMFGTLINEMEDLLKEDN